MAVAQMDTNALLNIFQRFSRLSDRMPVSYALAFIWIAKNESRNQLDLQHFMDVSNAAASRAVAFWAAFQSPITKTKSAVAMIEQYIDPEDRRYRCLRLTDAGRVMWRELRQGVM